MADARRGLFHVVCVWKLDSFARSAHHLLSALDEFRKLNIEFVSVRAGVRRAQATGKHCGRPKVDVDLRPAVALLQGGASMGDPDVETDFGDDGRVPQGPTAASRSPGVRPTGRRR